jgi:hypothetical protein
MSRRQLGGRREQYNEAVWTETILLPSLRGVQDDVLSAIVFTSYDHRIRHTHKQTLRNIEYVHQYVFIG